MSQRRTLLSRPHDSMTLPEGCTSSSVTLPLCAGLKDTHSQFLMRQAVIMPSSLPPTIPFACLAARCWAPGITILQILLRDESRQLSSVSHRDTRQADIDAQNQLIMHQRTHLDALANIVDANFLVATTDEELALAGYRAQMRRVLPRYTNQGAHAARAQRYLHGEVILSLLQPP